MSRLVFDADVRNSDGAPCIEGRVPNWAPTYNMSLSTVAMPCDYDGFMSDGKY